MKIIITENHIKKITFKYLDKMVEKGIQPKITSEVIKSFNLPFYDDSLYEYLIEYLGGTDNAINKTIKLLKELPHSINCFPDFNGEVYFSIYDIIVDDFDLKIPEIKIDVDIYGNVNDAEIWNDEIRDFEIKDTTLNEFYGTLGFGDVSEFRDNFITDINLFLDKNIRCYTGINIRVDNLSVII
jgi:hypothetical protein